MLFASRLVCNDLRRLLLRPVPPDVPVLVLSVAMTLRRGTSLGVWPETNTIYRSEYAMGIFRAGLFES